MAEYLFDSIFSKQALDERLLTCSGKQPLEMEETLPGVS